MPWANIRWRCAIILGHHNVHFIGEKLKNWTKDNKNVQNRSNWTIISPFPSPPILNLEERWRKAISTRDEVYVFSSRSSYLGPVRTPTNRNDKRDSFSWSRPPKFYVVVLWFTTYQSIYSIIECTQLESENLLIWGDWSSSFHFRGHHWWHLCNMDGWSKWHQF